MGHNLHCYDGDASDWASNFSSQFFSVQQSGGWFSAVGLYRLTPVEP
jgi:hypothetical protein